MNQNKLLSIFGASGHGKIVLAAAKQLGYDVIAFYDDNSSLFDKQIHNVRVKGVFDDYDSDENAIIGIGNNEMRKKVADQFKDVEWTAIVHPRSYIDGTALVGVGSLVCAGATIQIDTIIGVHTIINTNASVDHDCVIGDFVHIAPGVNLAGNVSVGDGSMLGIGSSVTPGVKIGKNSIVCAGSVVIRYVLDNTVVAGCPAEFIKRNDLVDV